MCGTCGCSEVGSIAIDGVVIEPNLLESSQHGHRHGHEYAHDHSHDHSHEHSHHHEPGHEKTHEHGHSHNHDSAHTHFHPHKLDRQHELDRTVRLLPIQQGILAKNDQIAAQNRSFLRDRGVLSLNLLSSPGAGKTALIERLARDWPSLVAPQGQTGLKMSVIVGDLATDHDAQRLRQAGAPAVQITTGNTCHLEAAMVSQAMQQLDWSGMNLLVIENVGNLVCPAGYDLGETLRVVILSVTEGEDKPLKYPTMFKSADVVLVSKMDVAAAVGCDVELAIANLARVAPQAECFQISARTGQGLAAWYNHLLAALPASVKAELALR